MTRIIFSYIVLFGLVSFLPKELRAAEEILSIDCWSGGWCTALCGDYLEHNYDCSNGHGGWTPTCYFNDPLPVGAELTKVHATLYIKECGTTHGTPGIGIPLPGGTIFSTYLNEDFIETVVDASDTCGCDEPCSTPITEREGAYPNYNYEASNYLEIIIDEGQICVEHVELTFIYDGDPELFIDIDGDFESDLNTYVPQGYDLISGNNPTIYLVAKVPSSLALGQTAYFELFDTTNFTGFAMNKGTSVQDDFQLVGPALVPFDSNGIAQTEVAVTDWGGFTRARVTIDPLGEVLEIEIPIDENDNLIADAQWRATDGSNIRDVHDAIENLDPCADDETQPLGRGINGDGLSNWEEYRGFFVRDQHRRTNPYHKDFFYAPRAVSPTFPFPGLGYINLLPTWDHWIYGGEADVHMAINFNRPSVCPAGGGSPLTLQRGVQIFDFLWHWAPPLIIYGHRVERSPSIPSERTPNNTLYCAVFSEVIQFINPPNYTRGVADLSDIPAKDVVVSHEVGHSLSIVHYIYPDSDHFDCSPAGPSCGPSSVMVLDFPPWARPDCSTGFTFNPCPDPGPFWTNIPDNFDAFDHTQIRLH
jgi:hypothetical protein